MELYNGAIEVLCHEGHRGVEAGLGTRRAGGGPEQHVGGGEVVEQRGRLEM